MCNLKFLRDYMKLSFKKSHEAINKSIQDYYFNISQYKNFSVLFFSVWSLFSLQSSCILLSPTTFGLSMFQIVNGSCYQWLPCWAVYRWKFRSYDFYIEQLIEIFKKKIFLKLTIFFLMRKLISQDFFIYL